MNKSAKKIVVMKEGDIPVVIGECPKCRRGERSLVIVDYIKNTRNKDLNLVKIECVACSKELLRYVNEVTE